MPTCGKCGKNFDSRAFGGHASQCGKTEKCQICGMEMSPQSMSRHKEVHERDHDCPMCGKRIYGYEDKKFCSQACNARFHNKDAPKRSPVAKKNCLGCGKQMERRGIFCGYVCMNEFKYREYIKKWLVGEVSGNQKDGETISDYVRRWLVERSGGKCEGKNDDGSRCSWARTNQFTKRIPLTAHHKDGNAHHTTPENMELICPGCHSLTETYGGGNRGKGRKARRVPVSQR